MEIAATVMSRYRSSCRIRVEALFRNRSTGGASSRVYTEGVEVAIGFHRDSSSAGDLSHSTVMSILLPSDHPPSAKTTIILTSQTLATVQSETVVRWFAVGIASRPAASLPDGVTLTIAYQPSLTAMFGAVMYASPDEPFDPSVYPDLDRTSLVLQAVGPVVLFIGVIGSLTRSFKLRQHNYTPGEAVWVPLDG